MLLTGEIAKAATSCLVTYTSPGMATAPKATHGMFPALGVYGFLRAAELLWISIPGMPVPLYEFMTSKAYQF